MLNTLPEVLQAQVLWYLLRHVAARFVGGEVQLASEPEKLSGGTDVLVDKLLATKDAAEVHENIENFERSEKFNEHDLKLEKHV